YNQEDKIASLVDQTRQMTVSESERLAEALSSDPNFKDLPCGTLHAGSFASEDPSHDEAHYAALVKAHDEMVADYSKRKGEKMTGEKCEICDTPLYSDPGPHELGIYLHALAYSDLNGAWSYRSPPPIWALPPDGYEGPTEINSWEYTGDEVLDIGDEKE